MSKRTPFYEIHKSLGAKIVDFAGFEMPVQYSGIIEEHLAVRNAVGVFDVSHMGEFEVRGSDALAFLQKVTINDVSKLWVGKVQYSAMCYEDGGMLDDLLVYRLKDRYLLVVNAANLTKDWDWLQSQKFGDVELSDISDATALLAIQGPESLATLQKLTNANLSAIEYYAFIQTELCGIPMIVSRTGYTGERGFELYFTADTTNAHHVWNAIFDAGKEFGVAPIGLGARDTLRLEMGFCLYGNDIDKTTNPLEAGLGWITKLNKNGFNGKRALVQCKKMGLQRKLVGFTLPDRSLARHGYELQYQGKCVGHVTSGTFSPTLQRGIGMGYVALEAAGVGTELGVVIREKIIHATIVDLPFVHKK
ncbi:MAG TPA: glycine cleavage system aminomethyltransferase GcvT [Bacteroidota bacterium]|nr:glycine cleavage system aminomethyltransferase GcvT [Bacteroidota bacterium]